MKHTEIIRILILAIPLVWFVSCHFESNRQDFHPMVDGLKLEYGKLNIKPIQIAKDVNLYIYQNEGYVWLSYDFPNGSYGTLDMHIISPLIIDTLNLHVSAQLGEWKLNDQASIPKEATSELWWNMNGWIANPLWVNGIDTVSYETPEFKIRNGEIREIQLSKARFGKGTWWLKLNINAIKDATGQFVSVTFPDGDPFYRLDVQ